MAAISTGSCARNNSRSGPRCTLSNVALVTKENVRDPAQGARGSGQLPHRRQVFNMEPNDTIVLNFLLKHDCTAGQGVPQDGLRPSSFVPRPFPLPRPC